MRWPIAWRSVSPASRAGGAGAPSVVVTAAAVRCAERHRRRPVVAVAPAPGGQERREHRGARRRLHAPVPPWISAASSAGASRGRPWPAPATTVGRGLRDPRRVVARSPSARTSRRARRRRPSPASSARRGGPRAAPSRRRRCRAAPRRAPAGRCAGGPRATARRLRRGAREQRLRHPAVGELPRRSIVLDLVGERARRRRRARARSAASSMPALVADEHQPRRRARARRARRAARRGRPASSRTGRSARGAAASTSATQPSKATGRTRGRRAVPAEVGGERAVAFGVERRAGPGPRRGRSRRSRGAGPASRASPSSLTMSETRDTYLLLRAFVDELRRCGVAGACTSPGSRSTPLVLDARARRADPPSPRTSTSARPRSSPSASPRRPGGPPSLACTSGTAAANYLPAVIEAHEARVPLHRPDRRPPAGAARRRRRADDRPDQALRRAAKWFFEVGDARGHAASACAGSASSPAAPCWTAAEGRPGPVHLNFPLREPLVLDEPLPRRARRRRPRRTARPWTARVAAPPGPRAAAGRLPRRPPLAGRGRDRRRPPAPTAPAAARRSPSALALAAARRPAVRRAPRRRRDRPLRRAAARRGLGAAPSPDVVLRVGDLPTSKPLRPWLAGLPARRRRSRSTRGGAWQDPDAALATVFDRRARATLGAIAERLPATPDAAWLGGWRDADARAAAALDRRRSARTAERAARRRASSARALPRGRRWSSSPPRCRSATSRRSGRSRDDPPRVLANRGANGIDGTISTAFGVAAADRRGRSCC